MIDQRVDSCLTFYQGKCPHLTMMEKFYLFPQILNAIDVELAEVNCLDCKKYIDRFPLRPKETTDQEKGKTKGDKEESCPFVENPPEGCYCYNLDTQANIENALYYCVKNFRGCEIYISIQKEKGALD